MPHGLMPNRAAAMGRGGDDQVGHLTSGEVVVPRQLAAEPDLRAELMQAFEKAGVPMGRYEVGGRDDSRNPQTGMREYFFGPGDQPGPNSGRGGGSRGPAGGSPSGGPDSGPSRPALRAVAWRRGLPAQPREPATTAKAGRSGEALRWPDRLRAARGIVVGLWPPRRSGAAGPGARIGPDAARGRVHKFHGPLSARLHSRGRQLECRTDASRRAASQPRNGRVDRAAARRRGHARESSPRTKSAQLASGSRDAGAIRFR